MYKSLVLQYLVESEVTSAPVGYQYTTPKNVEFYKSNAGWKNAITDKSVDAKTAERIETAALAEIEETNANSEFKIGRTYTDAQGNIYYYTGDDFVTVDGVSLSPDEADEAMKAVRDDGTDKKPDQPDDDKKEPAEQSSDKPAETQPEQQSDVEEKPDTDSTDADSTEKTEPAPEPKPAQKPQPVVPPTKPVQPQSVQKPAPTKPESEPASKSDEAINKLAQLIKRHPRVLRLRKLIKNGDPLSLLAADIILSGNDSKIKAEILNRLGEKK